MDVAPNYVDRVATAIRSLIPPGELPDVDTSALFRIYAVLLLAKREEVTEDVHNAWVAWMLDHQRSHESLVPFDELPTTVARTDERFVRAIRSVAQEIDTADF